MTTEEFKKLKPQYANIEGDELWDAMTEYMLRQQEGSEILKTTMPIWKTHTLRWLFYRKRSNWVMGDPKMDKWVSDNRCSKCKWGVNQRLVWSFRDEAGQWHSTCKCPHCNEDYVPEPNTNLSHKFYKAWKWISGLFWNVLDKIHLVRNSCNSRYEMGGDESRYIISWEFKNNGEVIPSHRLRKWWEYILIERPIHNF